MIDHSRDTWVNKKIVRLGAEAGLEIRAMWGRRQKIRSITDCSWNTSEKTMMETSSG